jgi:adenine-specific DNA-methyltransferase
MLPTIFAYNIALQYAKDVSSSRKKELGQFFTPLEIANFMADKININTNKNEIKILDPGFGTGILTCALIEHLTKEKKIKTIKLCGYEIDLDIIPYSQQVLHYLKDWLHGKNIELKYILHANDFIINNENKFADEEFIFKGEDKEGFDIVISNPPYFKIGKEDKRAIIAKNIVNGHPNIYPIFLYLSVKLLNPGGQFSFIVPRGFASGQYFKLFRHKFFKIVKLEWIHLFDSRKKTFNNEDVLQENIIIKGSIGKNLLNKSKITVSSSNSLRDLEKPKIKSIDGSDIIDLNSKEKILHIPINNNEEKIIKIFKGWSGNLNKYNLQISTGPVVSFRAKDFLSVEQEDNSYAPLFDLQNVESMNFQHPINKKNKPQYVKISNETTQILLPNKNYVLLRRFSAKEDDKRLIAAPYFMDVAISDTIGIENHLNYIYRPNGNMNRNEVLGIAALLNSKLFDNYFRIFNGNINVSATELRAMSLPSLDVVKEIGNQLILKNKFDYSVIEEIIEKILFNY